MYLELQNKYDHFSIENQHFPGEILHPFCTFNRILNKAGIGIAIRYCTQAQSNPDFQGCLRRLLIARGFSPAFPNAFVAAAHDLGEPWDDGCKGGPHCARAPGLLQPLGNLGMFWADMLWCLYGQGAARALTPRAIRRASPASIRRSIPSLNSLG